MNFLNDNWVPRKSFSNVSVDSNPSSPHDIISTSKSGNLLQSGAMEKTGRLLELVSQKIGVNNGPDVASKELKSREGAFCDMIYLLLEDMPEGEVKDMVKLDVHQLIVKTKYRASAQGNYVESQMQSNNNHSQRMFSSPNAHIHLPASNPTPVFAPNTMLHSTFSS